MPTATPRSTHPSPARSVAVPGRLLTLLLGVGMLVAVPGGAAIAQQAGEPRPRVAVLQFEGVEASEAEAVAATDQLRNELVNLEVFTVVDRERTEAVLEELAFQQGGVTDRSRAVEVGRVLNTEFIVTGRITRLPGAYQVNAQMIRVETAEISRSDTVLHRGDFLGLLDEQIPAVAAILADVQPQVAEAPPEEAEEPAEPAPAPQERAQVEKPSWPLWVGGGLLAVGVLSQLGASGKNQQAQTLAEESRQEDDPDKYNEAVTLRDEAESQAGGAFLLMAAGTGFLIYYSLMEGEETTAGMRRAAPPPVWVTVQPGGVRAAWTMRW